MVEPAKNLHIIIYCALIIFLTHKGSGTLITHGCTGTYVNLNCSFANQFIVVQDIYYELSKEGKCDYTHVKCSHRTSGPLHICTGFKTCEWLILSYEIQGCGKSDQAVISYRCVQLSAVTDICDGGVRVLEEREGYIASPDYSDLHSATGSINPGQYQASFRCSLTVSVPKDHGYTVLYFYVKDLDFRTSKPPTTPSDLEERDNTDNAQNGRDTCIRLTEILANNIKGKVQTICSLQGIETRDSVFTSRSLHVEVTYWSTNEDFNSFLLHFVAIMDSTTTGPTLPAHALRGSGTQRSTVLVTENQIDSPTPTETLDAVTTNNASDWNDLFSEQRESKPWATAVGAAIGCIAAILMIALVVVLIVEKKRKKSTKEPRIYDEVPHPDDASQINNKVNQEIYENIHAHTNAGFVDELNHIIKKNITTHPKKTAKPSKDDITKEQVVNGGAKNVAKTESLEANMNLNETCDSEAFYEDSVPVELEAETLTKSAQTAEDNIYINHEAVDDTKDSKEDATNESIKQDMDPPCRKPRYSPKIDLQKAQEIYENAAFPVKYSRIATPRICERSRQDSKKGKSEIKMYDDTAQPVLQKLERPKVSVRRNHSVLSDSELIYDDVPDENAEYEESEENKPVKPPIKPKPRLSKILGRKNKTPSPRLKSVNDNTVMVDNELYTCT